MTSNTKLKLKRAGTRDSTIRGRTDFMRRSLRTFHLEAHAIQIVHFIVYIATVFVISFKCINLQQTAQVC
jgi:hypothetical protein